MPVVEFVLDPADAPRLLRVPGMARPGRAGPIAIEWHDTDDAALARDGLVLMATPGRWALDRLRAPHAAAAAETVAEARRKEALDEDLPDGLHPVAAFTGRRRRLAWSNADGNVLLRLLDGRMAGRSGAALCRISLDGPAPAVDALATLLARNLAIAVPRASLSGQALAAAAGVPPPPRALGAPKVEHGAPVTDSLATIMGHLLDAMLHWADKVPLVPGTGAGAEPVHQMRVATRRLRSALSIFKHVAPCPHLAGLAVPMRDCATRLGRARDWDVFLDGTGKRLAEAFPDDPRCAAMLRAGARRRRAAYAELRGVLTGPEFRQLTVAVALAVALRPWMDPATDGRLTQDTAVFAADVLEKHAKRVRKAGRDIENLPVPALHELRKDCKRLRYSAEFFASLFHEKPGKRYLKRLAALQEELGLLNDSAAITGLMAQLGRAERGYAAGLVEGFSMAEAGPARQRIVREWRRFRAAEPFWAR